MRSLILGSLLIILISYLVFLPSFNLALFGDDWLAIWRYLQHLGPTSSGEWNHLTYFLTPYGAQDILMGFLKNIYGFDPRYYFIISFLLRLFASFSLYPLVFYLTRSKLATFFAILFFSITIVGLDTTTWVFNMPTYITVGLFNLALYFFIKSREENQQKQFFFAVFFYYFAYIITPIRMHGSLPFLFLLEFFYVLQKKDFKIFKRALIRLVIILLVFLFIRFSGQSLGPSSEISERLTQGFNISGLLLNQGRYDFIFHPLIILGSMIIPDFLISQIVGISSIGFTTFFLSILFLLFFLIIYLLLTKTFFKFFSLSLLLTFLSWIFFPKNIESFPNNIITSSASLVLFNVGGYIFILLILLIIENWRKERFSTGLIISFMLPILSFFAAWWFTPQVIFPTAYRYLIISAVGISIFLASLISLGKKYKNELYLTIILSSLLILHILSTNYYLRLMESFHSQKISDKIWSSIPYIPEMGKKPLVFYFEGDSNNFIILHNVITFGFPPHMQLLYNLTEKEIAPVPMRDFSEVISAVKDGKSFAPYGYELKPIPIDNVFAFHLQGQDNLVNITDIVRKKLSEEK